MKISTKEWDSFFFQLKIGEYLVENDNEMEHGIVNYDLIYAIASNNFKVEIPNFVNTYSEVQTSFLKKNTTSISQLDNVFIVKDLNSFKLEEIYELAFESGKYSRFYLDENFSFCSFKNLYKKWVDNSLNGEFADIVLVYQQLNSIIGFITCSIACDIGTIGLFGVEKKHQGNGIGEILLNALQLKLFEEEVNYLRVKTQCHNKPAVNFYKKHEFHLESEKYIKHFWRI